MSRQPVRVRSVLRRVFGAVILAVLIMPAQPGQAQPPVSEQIRVQASVPANLDPVGLPRADKAARDITENIFLGLVRYNPATGQFDKALARSWTTSADNLTWTFQLRTDISWIRRNASTGQPEAVRPISPGDFVYGIRRACDQAPPNPESPEIFIIAGCTTINNANPIQVNDVFIARNLRVVASGADRLDITFAFPVTYTQALLALPEFRPVPREAVSTNATWAADPSTILTNGPYVISAWDTSQITLARNPFWPDAFTGNVTQVTYTNALGAPFDASRLRGDPANGIIDSIVVLGFSTERPGVGTDGFRRALALSIDRVALVSAEGNPLFQPASGLASGSDRPNGGFDLAAAKAALGTTPYAGCNRLPDKFDIGVEDSPAGSAAAQALISAWNKGLGCNAASFNVRRFNAARLLRIASGATNVDENQQGTPRPHMWIVGWSPDYHDRNAWTADVLHCRYGFLRTGLPCGDVDALLDAAGNEADTARRNDAYAKAEALWFDVTGSFPVVPLYRVAASVSIQPWVNGALSMDGTDAAFRFDLWQVDTARRTQG